jgi:hypothetical protein
MLRRLCSLKQRKHAEVKTQIVWDVTAWQLLSSYGQFWGATSLTHRITLSAPLWRSLTSQAELYQILGTSLAEYLPGRPRYWWNAMINICCTHARCTLVDCQGLFYGHKPALSHDRQTIKRFLQLGVRGHDEYHSEFRRIIFLCFRFPFIV